MHSDESGSGYNSDNEDSLRGVYIITVIITIILYFIIIGLSAKSGEVIVMTAFTAHFLKDISRSQLMSAAKSLLSSHDRKQLHGAEKSHFMVPLGKAFVENGIVRIDKGACVESLVRNNASKIGTF